MENPIPDKTISRESLDAMFKNMSENTSWDINGVMLWGYFFTHDEPETLERLRDHLVSECYRFVDIHLSEEKGTPPIWWLHVEKEEVHSPATLDDRNDQFYLLASRLGVSYDGMDVGPVVGDSTGGKCAGKTVPRSFSFKVAQFRIFKPRLYGFLMLIPGALLTLVGSRVPWVMIALMLLLFSVCFGITGALYMIFGAKCNEWDEQMRRGMGFQRLSWKFLAGIVGIIFLTLLLYWFVR